ncbi:hypothetical protein [Nocardia sp. NPDC059228]|uniref:hypothetical protein n=1 Tax=Nocardia sp. NPDC059228 TaxID=3346777 RepID=UPI00369C1326
MLSYQCAFCDDAVHETSADLRVLKVSAAEKEGFQELFVHRRCLVAALRPAFPLGPVLEPTVAEQR